MARDASPPGPDPERKRTSSERSRAAAAPEARRDNGGSSGYGMDSIRRNLRRQLDQRRLLRPGPAPWDEDETPAGGKRRGSG